MRGGMKHSLGSARYSGASHLRIQTLVSILKGEGADICYKDFLVV